MSRRIEIELTSVRDDGVLTWRAAGAREPKGIVDASLLPEGVQVGDVLRADAEFYVDGIEITAVMAPRNERKEPEKLELLGSDGFEGGVTTTLVGRRGRRSGPDSGERSGGGRRREPRRGGEGDRGKGRSGARRSADKNDKRKRPERAPAKPKSKRLRPKRTHRDAAIAELPEIQHPLAKEVVRGGIPGLRKLIDEQNAEHREAGRPEVDPTPLLELAEKLLPSLKAAEWTDRAEAALSGIDEVDLRDLRSVVVAAESGARTEEARALADQLRDGLAKRVEAEHEAWLKDIAKALTEERTVRALRMSSRPPKAGALMPADLTTRLTEAAGAALTGDTAQQRWGTVVDAVAFSPVRQAVQPQGIPSDPGDELLDTVRRLSTRVPQIAALFGIEPTEAPKRRRGRSGRGRGPRSDNS